MSHSQLWLIAGLLLSIVNARTGAADLDGPLPAAPPDGRARAAASAIRAENSIRQNSPAPSPFAWSTILRELTDEAVPRDYEVRRGWGDQTEVISGVRVRSQNGLPRISKRTRRVNHGVWRRFRIALHRPDEKLRFAIRDVRQAERGGLTFKVVAAARVRCAGQSEFWSFGVQTGSVTAQADATVRIVARFEVVGRERDPEDDGWLMDVEYVPNVDRVRIELDDFDVRRVGHLDGDVADGLGNTAQRLLAEVLHSQEDKVTRRIQRELTERDARIELTVPRVLWEGGAEGQ